RALETVGFRTPTPGHTPSVPPVLAGRDLQAPPRAGTGKTAGSAMTPRPRTTPGSAPGTGNRARARARLRTRRVPGHVHDPHRHQTSLLSATFSDAIRQLAEQMLDDPLTIEVSPRNVAASSVKQWVVTVDKKRKPELFIHLLKKLHWSQVLVFAKTRVGVDQLV